MAPKDEPTYTDLVYETLRSAGRPLTFQEIFDEVDRRRPISTRNPQGTIRNVLSQGKQLVSLGDGRYGYLPHLVPGSLLRVPLTARKPADGPLPFPMEVRMALWPSWLEAAKRMAVGPVRARLPDGVEVDLSMEGFGDGKVGRPMPDGLRRYLAETRAGQGDSLLIRVLDAEAGRSEAWFEARRKRNGAVVAARNRALAEAAYQILQDKRSWDMPLWDLAVALLARGFFRSEVAPDPLDTVLAADPRFRDAGLQAWALAEAVTPELQAAIDYRKKMEADMHARAQMAPEGPPAAPQPPALRQDLDRLLADMAAVLAGQNFGSLEEANAQLQEIMQAGRPPRHAAAGPLDRAQDLMYDAWEATNPRERVKLARKALELSPDCADAYVLLAQETARSLQEAADLYARGMAAGERALGPKTFEEDVGYFWGLMETRPYMRARLGLAETLWEMGRQQEAVGHARELLRLNPNDNQGVRYRLLNWLLETGDDAGVKKLLGRYPDDAAAAWAYGRALHAFRREGDTERARKLLAKALRTNPHVPAYLLGRKRLPRQLPEIVGFGDESEAIDCAAVQRDVWRATPGALPWLSEQVG